MTTPPMLRQLRHDVWATEKLIAHCRTLSGAQLDLTAPGTYGTVYGTLQHLVGAEQWYVKLLTGEVLGRPIRRTDAPHSLDELVTIATATGARAVVVATADDPLRVIALNERESSTVGVVLAQLVHHANEHRTQVTTILGANGIAPPSVSGWGYGLAAGISDTEE